MRTDYIYSELSIVKGICGSDAVVGREVDKFYTDKRGRLQVCLIGSCWQG